MKLSQQDQLILWGAQHESDAALSDIARKVNLREHTVRAGLKRLAERGAIVRMTAINVSPLGYTNYDVYLSINIADPRQRVKFETSVKESEAVSMLVELGGEYEYGVTICGRSINEVSEFFHYLSDSYGDIFTRKAIAIRESYFGFGRKYLVGKQILPIVKLETRPALIAIDAIDHAILQKLTELGVPSQANIARSLGMPLTTLAYRIQKLKESGVIERFIYGVELENEGIAQFRLLLSAKSYSRKTRSAIFNLCAIHPRIINLIVTAGPWDYEVGVEVPRQADLKSTVRDIQSALGANLNSIVAVPIFKIVKVRNYPFKKYEATIFQRS